MGIPAGIWDIDTFAELSNIGTLFAFVLVSAGVIVLRKKQPERPRVVPRSLRSLVSPDFDWLLPGPDDGVALLTWIRFFVWLFIGFAIYFPFGRKHSTLAGR